MYGKSWTAAACLVSVAAFLNVAAAAGPEKQADGWGDEALTTTSPEAGFTGPSAFGLPSQHECASVKTETRNGAFTLVVAAVIVFFVLFGALSYANQLRAGVRFFVPLFLFAGLATMAFGFWVWPSLDAMSARCMQLPELAANLLLPGHTVWARAAIVVGAPTVVSGVVLKLAWFGLRRR